MTEITHQTVEANGIRIHLAEAGKGRSSCFATAFRNPGTRGAFLKFSDQYARVREAMAKFPTEVSPILTRWALAWGG